MVRSLAIVRREIRRTSRAYVPQAYRATLERVRLSGKWKRKGARAVGTGEDTILTCACTRAYDFVICIRPIEYPEDVTHLEGIFIAREGAGGGGREALEAWRWTTMTTTRVSWEREEDSVTAWRRGRGEVKSGCSIIVLVLWSAVQGWDATYCPVAGSYRLGADRRAGRKAGWLDGRQIYEDRSDSEW